MNSTQTIEEKHGWPLPAINPSRKSHTIHRIAWCIAAGLTLSLFLASLALAKDDTVAKKRIRGLLTPESSILLMVDFQSPFTLTVKSIDRQSLLNNTTALAKVAKVFDIPHFTLPLAQKDSEALFFRSYKR